MQDSFCVCISINIAKGNFYACISNSNMYKDFDAYTISIVQEDFSACTVSIAQEEFGAYISFIIMQEGLNACTIIIRFKRAFTFKTKLNCSSASEYMCLSAKQ